MKTYIDAELQIVRMNNNDIVTTSMNLHNGPVITDPNQVNAPGRRRNIWD